MKKSRAAKYEQHWQQQRQFCVLGIDDTPFDRQQNTAPVAGVICANTRFEGMLWTRVTKDGNDANVVLTQQIMQSKFYPQLHLVLIDGIALGGFNVIDLPQLAVDLALPCVAVMRRPPDMQAIQAALENLQDGDAKMARILKAGEIYEQDQIYYQVAGLDPELTGRILSQRLTDRGHVPEALRLAHLIGSAIAYGESGRRA